MRRRPSKATPDARRLLPPEVLADAHQPPPIPAGRLIRSTPVDTARVPPWGPLVWEHVRRKCVNGAVCECGCGSTRVRVIARQRGLAQSLAARRRVVEAWAL